ncbi:MAG: hypothetical protein QM619_14610 [Micropruina sp.]|uniref:hypothetical protein n=1 Tax=Micropruina sp. TaxID=2737536 RepID=UPI0039E37613
MDPDEVLLGELAEALAEASGADDVAAVGRSLWSWHDPDAQLADLVSDPAVEPLAGVRSTGDARLLRFTAEGVGIDLELLDGHLRGLVVSPAPRTLALHDATGTIVADTELDASGWFDLAVPAGLGRGTLVRLGLSDNAGNQTWTAWFRL